MNEGREEAEERARRDFAKRLNAHIDQAQISHRDLAAAADVALASITNWTQGKSDPGLRSLRGLSRALQVPLTALVEDEDDALAAAHRKLVAELATLRLRPAVQRLGDSAPSLLDLLAEAERLAGGGDQL